MQTKNLHILRQLQGQGLLPIFFVLCFAVWLHAVNSLLAATTLPSIVEEIGGARYVSWAFSLYQLGSIVAGTVTGLIVSRHGLRTSLLCAGVVYGLGSVVCAVAYDMMVLLAGRLTQGVGGGCLVALTFVAVSRLFPAAAIPRLMAIISVVWSTSTLCGPMIGGSLATLGHWRIAFWAFVVQVILFLWAVVHVIERDDTDNRRSKRVDKDKVARSSESMPLGRLALVAGCVLSISAAGAEYHPIVSPLLCAASVVFFYGFLYLDNTSGKSRMFPSGCFDPRTTVGAGLIMVLAAATSTMSFLVYGTFLLEILYDVTPLTAGYIVALEALGWGAAAMLFSGISEASEKWLIRAGSLTVTVGVVGFAIFMPLGNLWAIPPWAICEGAGFGMMWGFVVRRLTAMAKPVERDIVSSAIPTTQQLGFAMGAAATGIVANVIGFGDSMSAEVTRSVAFWIFAAFIPLVLVSNIAAWKLSS